MKRTLWISLLTFVVATFSASAAQACCFFPFTLLNPFTWGCGCGYGYGGYGYGMGYGGCGYSAPYAGGYGYAPAPQMYAPPVYQPQMYAPSYAPAPVQPGCSDCVSMTPQPQLTAVRVPVTTYRAVTQYVPQTTYQTQYQWGQSSMAYGTGMVPQATYAAPAPTMIGSGYAPTYTTPQIATPYMSAPYPTGDISGDHEYPSTSSLVPTPQTSMNVRVPIQPATYRVAPRTARTYSQSVR
ncbi:MAG: hypothetical protein R3C19_27345 [Planctomycetaceae bacterium]